MFAAKLLAALILAPLTVLGGAVAFAMAADVYDKSR